MRAVLPTAAVALAALCASAFAHGGNYADPVNQGAPPARNGRDPEPGPTTRWESWWTSNRDDLLKIAERVDAMQQIVSTPRAGEATIEPSAATRRAALAASVREDVLAALFWAMHENDFDMRASACVALGKVGDARAVEPLRQAALHDERDVVRRAALLGLGLLGRHADLPFLTDVLGDRKADVNERAFAAFGAGLIGGDDAASFMAFFLEKESYRPDSDIRKTLSLHASVNVALGLTGSIEALRTLWRAADDESLDPAVRAYAVLALGRLKDHDSLDRCLKLLVRPKDACLRRAAAVTLGKIATPTDLAVVPALRDALRGEGDAVAREYALFALGASRDPVAGSVLRVEFERGPENDRCAAALAMGVQGDGQFASILRKALEDEREESRAAAYCAALALVHDPAALPLIRARLSGGEQPGLHRGYAALSLAILGDDASRDTLWKRLPDERDPRVRANFAIALGLLGDERVRAYLIEQLKNGDGIFDRASAAECLGVLRRRDVVPELVEMVKNRHADGIVRALCIVALGDIGDPSPVPKLSRFRAESDYSTTIQPLAEVLTIL